MGEVCQMLILCEWISGPAGGKLLGFLAYFPPGTEHPIDLHFAWLCEKSPEFRVAAQQRGDEIVAIPAEYRAPLDQMAVLDREELEAIVTDARRDVWDRLLAHEFLMSNYDLDELQALNAWQLLKIKSFDDAEMSRLAAQRN